MRCLGNLTNNSQAFLSVADWQCALSAATKIAQHPVFRAPVKSYCTKILLLSSLPTNLGSSVFCSLFKFDSWIFYVKSKELFNLNFYQSLMRVGHNENKILLNVGFNPRPGIPLIKWNVQCNIYACHIRPSTLFSFVVCPTRLPITQRRAATNKGQKKYVQQTHQIWTDLPVCPPWRLGRGCSRWQRLQAAWQCRRSGAIKPGRQKERKTG